MMDVKEKKSTNEQIYEALKDYSRNTMQSLKCLDTEL